MKRYTTQEFIEKSKIIHKNFYDYSKVNYINNDTKVTITCHLHGEFTITPKKHLLGQGCKECGYLNRPSRRKDAQLFINQVKKIHGDLYDYSLTNYTTAREKISIICKKHGVFHITPNNHLNGQGCSKCSLELDNFKKSNWIKKAQRKNVKYAIFYIIKCYNENEEFYKFGITFNSIQDRYNSRLMPYKYEIVRNIKSKDLDYIWKLEKRFKKFKVKNRYTPKIKFSGHKTECFK